MVRPAICAAIVAAATAAGAEPAATEPAVAATAGAERPDLIVAEAFGKLGLYGLGYERELGEHLSLGVAGAFWIASGRRVLATAAYLGTGGQIAGPHRWFAQIGPELAWEREPAVAGFSGVSSTALGVQLTAGYEYRRDRFVVRGHAVLTGGRGGVAPWAGTSVGLRL